MKVLEFLSESDEKICEVEIEDDIFDSLEEEAREKGVSFEQLIRNILMEKLDSSQKMREETARSSVAARMLK